MDNNQQEILSSMELDTIGEVMNISMGSAATAVSNMLAKQVIISTPNVKQKKFDTLEYTAMEPAMLVSISYIEGISGTNIMVFRQRDMQVILNLLMGNDEEPSDNFEFDELSMSAACEVMNQMMGSSATALSEFLGLSVNISTPEAKVVSSVDEYYEAIGVSGDDEIVSITFKLDIVGVMSSDFVCVLPLALAKDIVSRVTIRTEDQLDAIPENTAPEPEPAPQPAPQQSEPQPPAPQQAAPHPQTSPQQAQAVPPQQMPSQQAQTAPQQQMPPQPMPGMPYGGMPNPYDPNQAAQMGGWYGGYMPPYPPYMYPQQPGMMPPYGAMEQAAPVTIKNTQFPTFTPQVQTNPNGSNMDLLLGVNLDVSVEIGKAKRKIKDIVEFGQGTVIELNKQAGAPVDIMVNGRLLAHGDVVVIDDNFGVRITEIVGTKELMDSLKEENM